MALVVAGDASGWILEKKISAGVCKLIHIQYLGLAQPMFSRAR
jgi:hypothetical protein